jgi:uncharacterized protein
MKFQPETSIGVNAITRHEPGRVWVGATAWERSVIVPWQGPALNWGPVGFDALVPADFERILSLKPELVLFGSGARLRFAHTSLLRALIEHRIGVETMDTAAACRTYNVLASENRSVVAALILEATAAQACAGASDL